jgi:hypothetical protein
VKSRIGPDVIVAKGSHEGTEGPLTIPSAQSNEVLPYQLAASAQRLLGFLGLTLYLDIDLPMTRSNYWFVRGSAMVD